MARILLADDSEDFVVVLREFLVRAGHEVITASNGIEALEAVGQSAFDLLITDIVMPEKEGLETITEMRRRAPSMKIIAISGGGRLGARDYLAAARVLGASATLPKPFVREDLLKAVDSVLGRGT